MRSVAEFKRDSHRLCLIRAGFTAQGTSFHAWCSSNGINTQNARKAVIGKWTGPKASALVDRIEAAAMVRAA